MARTPTELQQPPVHPAIEHARQVLETEAEAIRSLLPRLGPSFIEAVELVLTCRGRVVVTGMGKAGFVGQKLSATFASTGTPSHFLHPGEALHGDLGRVTGEDLVIALSNSGETEELSRLLPAFRRMGVTVVAITGNARSTLGAAAKVVLDLGNIEEACPMGLAPTASSVALLAMGDALAMTVLSARPFTTEEYALFHPGGKLGRQLLKVSELMRTGLRNPVVSEDLPLVEVIGTMTRTPGRPGAACVTDGLGRLAGIFTDGDLRRLVEQGTTDFTVPVGEVMTRDPITVRGETLALDAASVLRERQIDQVPVVDGYNRPVGLLDVQDLLAARLLDET